MLEHFGRPVIYLEKDREPYFQRNILQMHLFHKSSHFMTDAFSNLS